jgi:hypothetical protein
MPLTKLVERQRFEDPAFDRLAGAKTVGEVIGNAHRDFGVAVRARGAVVHILFSSPGRYAVKLSHVVKGIITWNDVRPIHTPRRAGIVQMQGATIYVTENIDRKLHCARGWTNF